MLQTRLYAPQSLIYFITAIVICLIWSWYLIDLDAGHIWRFDEFYTYDRSTGFARNDDWFAVYSNNEPSLKKPPLQYWISGLLIEFGVPDMLALRLPSMVFALGVLIATACLARAMLPELPWAMPMSVLLLATSLEFWRYASSAMLDAGAAFFTTLGFAAMFAAFERPRYWPLFGVVAVLAALQKSPTPLAFLALALLALVATRRWQTSPPRDIWRDPRFRKTILISVLLSFAWPIVQEARFALDGSLDGSVKRQMLDRFAPSISARGLSGMSELILGKEIWLRAVGFLGICALPFLLKRPRLFAATGIVVLFVVMMWAASGRVYARYTLLILPLLMVGAAGLALSLGRFRWIGTGALLALVFAAGGPIKDRAKIQPSTSNYRFGMPMSEVLLPLGQALQPHEALVICGLDKSRPRVPPGAASAYASNGQRFVFLSRMELASELREIGFSTRPLRGFCHAEELEQIAPELIGLETTPSPAEGYMYWTASGHLDLKD